KDIPCLIKDYSSQDSIEIALIENIQREELNPLETAEAFDRLIKEFKITQEELSQRVGKERATITNYLRVLKLPEEIKTFINNEQISIGHAKALLILDDRKAQIEAAKEVVKKGLSVRATEQLCNRFKDPDKSKKKSTSQKSLEAIDIEDKLTRALGTKVKLHHKQKRGKIEIEYYSLDELDRLLEYLLR
ncbi:MAG: ParB/RepB/Spo0J family partition protein, partial [Thermodesulfovibrionales bacterium]|nr:ParB/RepB/Spo0J family partition protein [Thermodesulfovibrionales bacterium]